MMSSVFLIIYHQRLKTDSWVMSIFRNCTISREHTVQICSKVQFVIFASRGIDYFCTISWVYFSDISQKSTVLSTSIVVHNFTATSEQVGFHSRLQKTILPSAKKFQLFVSVCRNRPKHDNESWILKYFLLRNLKYRDISNILIFALHLKI